MHVLLEDALVFHHTPHPTFQVDLSRKGRGENQRKSFTSPLAGEVGSKSRVRGNIIYDLEYSLRKSKEYIVDFWMKDL